MSDGFEFRDQFPNHKLLCVWVSVTYTMWTWEQKMSTLCRILRHYVDTKGFHQLENLNFLKKEAFQYIPSQNGVDYSRERLRKNPLEKESSVQMAMVWKKGVFLKINDMRTKECPHRVCNTNVCGWTCLRCKRSACMWIHTHILLPMPSNVRTSSIWISDKWSVRGHLWGSVKYL